MASEIMRALMSMPEAMPERAGETAPVVVLVTGVLVSPSPIPARMQPGSIVSQFASSIPLPSFISMKPRPMVNSPAGMTRRGW